MNKEELINAWIKEFKLDTNKISDGYHTFEELYEHRIVLFIVMIRYFPVDAWKSIKHSDGSVWDGWFILGIGKEHGKQITYHLPMSYWDIVDVIAVDKAPEWDGHTSADVLERLKQLL